MKQYKTITALMLLTSLQITSSYATYTIMYPLNNVNFTNQEVPEEPIETWSEGADIASDWVYGEKTCNNWAPATNTKPIGVNFQQTANDCTGEKTRTVQHTEISSLGHTRNVGTPINESETENNQSDTRDATGVRYTHTIQISHYFGWGTTDYYGYFAPVGSYNSFERYDPVSLTPATINGQQIEYLTEQNGATIFRTINGVGQDELLNYAITVNGRTCPLEYNDTTIPAENRLLVARCAFFKSLSGQTVQVDISPR